MAKALIDLTDEELKNGLRQEAESVRYSYSAYVEEISRRSQDRHANAIRWLTFATVLAGLVAAAAAIISVLK
jgi:hypothetical protein